MALLSLVDSVSTYFAARGVPSTAVYGERARPAQGNARPGTRGGRVSFLWTGNGSYKGPGYLGPRAADDTISDPALVELAARVRVARLGHWAEGAPVHLAASSPTVPAAPTSTIEAFDVANAVRLAELEHDASTAAHLAADTVNAITAPAASNRTTLRTLLLQLQERGAAHDRSLTAHGAADEDHDVTADDPLSTIATTRSIAQLHAEVEAEVWAWDDSAPTDDATQFEAWLSLHEWTLNAVRAYARGVHKFDKIAPATKSVHVLRGKAALCYFTLPIPVHELPNLTPLAVTADITGSVEFPKGTEPDGTAIPPVVVPVLEP